MHAYFDAFSGIAGDMTVAALLDLGVPFADLERTIGTLGLDGYALAAEPTEKGPIRATRFRVDVSGKQPHRTFKTIRALLEQAPLAAGVRDQIIPSRRSGRPRLLWCLLAHVSPSALAAPEAAT